MPNRRDGFSMVEVLVATCLVVVCFLALRGLLTGSVRAVHYGEDYLRALKIAQQQVEMLRYAAKINRRSLDDLIAGRLQKGGFKDFVVEDKYLVHLDVDPAFFLSELKASFPKGGPHTETHTKATLCRVRVQVRWHAGKTRSELVEEALIDGVYN